MSTKTEYPLRTKVLAWLSLTSVQIISSTILKLATHNGAYTFSPQSSLTISEALKLLLSVMYHVNTSPRSPRRDFQQQSSPALIGHMLALAGIYCVNNGIMFHLFAHADPGSITLIKSGATVVSALMLRYVRSFRLSGARWAAVVLQMAGLIVAQYDACTGRAHLATRVYALLVVSLLNSSVANVWNEHVVKQFQHASLATKNIYLYMFGAALNLGIFQQQRRRGGAPEFWEGYGWAGAGVVVSNAFMGLAINAVYKYADAVVKNIATTSTTVVLLVLSGAVFDGRADVTVFLGASVVVLSTYLYFSIGAQEAAGRYTTRERGAPQGG